MQKFLDRITKFVVPFSERISKIAYFRALAETFQILLPITVVGSFAVLFAFIDIAPWQNFMKTVPNLQFIFMNTHSWTLAIIALYVVVVLPYRYAAQMDMKEAANTVPITLATFLLLTPTQLYTAIPSEWLGHRGMFTALLIGFAVPRLLKLFVDKKWTIKMPAGVPKYVTDTFAVLIPAFIILFGSSVLGKVLEGTSFGSIHNLIYTIIQAPLKNVGLSFPGFLVTEILMTLTMFAGIHGQSAVPYMAPLLTTAGAENLQAMAAGTPLPNTVVWGLANSIQAGGIGATLGLGILLFFLAKSSRLKQLSRVAIVPQIFNIGEPLLFGIPIMLNPLLFIPYMGGVIANTFIAYFAVASGLIAKFSGAEISWTLPHPLQGLLGNTQPLQGLILCLVILAVDMLIWYPFVKIIDRNAQEEENAAAKAK